MVDWYRRKSWTKTDEQEFFAKLARARKDGRAQYLKIQAIELVETEDKTLLKVAETLLNKMLTEYPDDGFQKGSAFHTLGDIYKLNDNLELAIDFYKQALDFETNYPNVITHAYLDYSELVIKTGKENLFGELEKLLLDRYSELRFPIEKYKVNSILSIINANKDGREQAEKYADIAEQFATAETSGLKYHKYLGIVKERDIWLDKLVRKK